MNLTKIRIIILLILLAVTIFFRAYGLDSHPVHDESYEVRRAINVLEGEFDWSRIAKGGLYILLVPIYFVVNLFSQDYSSFLFAARIVQVMIGTALIVFLFFILRTLFDDKWAYLFILPAIFNAQLIYIAHHANVQNLMFLGVIIHIFFIIKYFNTGDLKSLCKSLIPLSVAMASQLSSIILIIPFFIYCVILIIKTNREKRKNIFTSLLKYGLISMVIYILLTPGIIIYLKNVIIDIAALSGLKEGASLLDTAYGINLWTEYAKYIVNFFGKLNLLLIVASVFLILLKRKWFYLYPLSIFVLFYLIFTNVSQTAYSGRYIIPGLLMGFIILPLPVVEWSYWLTRYKKHIRIIFLAIPITLIGLYFYRSITFSWEDVRKYTLPDTRDLVTEWLNLNTTSSDRILLEDTSQFPKVPNEQQAVYVEGLHSYTSLDSVIANIIIINKDLLIFYDSKKIESSYKTFYDELMPSKQWEVIYSVQSIKNKINGPEILVFHNRLK